MITKERLKELIEQGAKVWCVCDYSYDKSNPNKKVEYYDFSYLSDEYKRTDLDIDNYISSVEEYTEFFETKEEAEWHKEFKNITRTDRLELPTWEEFIKGKEIYFHDDIGMAYKLVKTQFSVKPNMIYLFEEGIQGDYISKKYELTKENYTLACRKCKELFLGLED